MKKNQIKKLTRLLKETFETPEVFLTVSYLESSKKSNLTDILTSIRTIVGVTVVSVDESLQGTETTEKSILHIKFVPNIRLKKYIENMKQDIRKLPGVIKFLFKKIEKLN